MASVHKRPKTKYWWAAWRGVDGKLCFRSTGQTDRSEAKRMALQFELAAKLAKKGELTESRARSILNDILKQTDAGVLPAIPSIEAWFAQWLEGQKARASAGVYQKAKLVGARFLESLGDRVKRAITTLAPADLQRHLDILKAQGSAAESIRGYAKVLKNALDQARRQGHPMADFSGMILPKARSLERGTFSPDQVAALVRAAEGEMKVLIQIGYYTGARLMDCARMKWSDLDLAAGTWTFRQRKTSEGLKLPLHPTLVEVLTSLAGTDTPAEFVLPRSAGGFSTNLSQAFLATMATARIDPLYEQSGTRKLPKLSFHSLRHSFSSALANAGISAELRMKLTGHKSSAVHQGYTHLAETVLRDAIGKLPSIT